MASRILVLGGYGVFGGRLARRLCSETDAEVLVAGRSLRHAEAHCRKHGGTPVALDRDGDIVGKVGRLRPHLVIDAAGPFQAYGSDPYRVARAAIAAGAYYLDLADDAAFVAGIGTLDDSARAAGVAVVSGASSVPAISAAALDVMTQGLKSVAVVGSAILPGNRAPRGLSVVRAIVAQAGRRLPVWRGCEWRGETAWGELRPFALSIDGAPPLASRLASPIGAPDLLLFPSRYAARSALFHAGLELKLLHVGLWLLALPVRLGLARSLAPLAPMLKWIADRLETFGSDRGGMRVYAIGRDDRGNSVERGWTLIAEAGDGPEIPPTPALLLARKIIDGRSIEPGARSAAGALSLSEVEAGLGGFHIAFGRDEWPAPPLMQRVLPADFAHLPEAWQRLADVHDSERFEGLASVERGTGLPARLVGLLFGFPKSAASVAVSVTKHKTRRGERWTRSFAGKSFISHLSRRFGDAPGVLRERFGPFSFKLHLSVRDGVVQWPVESWRFLGMPMPRLLMPESRTSEHVDSDGVFRFDVAISLPFAGLIVRYRGFLEPLAPLA